MTTKKAHRKIRGKLRVKRVVLLLLCCTLYVVAMKKFFSYMDNELKDSFDEDFFESISLDSIKIISVTDRKEGVILYKEGEAVQDKIDAKTKFNHGEINIEEENIISPKSQEDRLFLYAMYAAFYETKNVGVFPIGEMKMKKLEKRIPVFNKLVDEKYQLEICGDKVVRKSSQ